MTAEDRALFGNRHIILRIWWACAVHRIAGAILFVPERGCRRIVLRRGDHLPLLDYRSPRAWLDTAPGQRFVCCGPGVVDTVAVEVIAVDELGSFTVRTLGGAELSPGCAHVQITRLAARYERAVAP
jgi:hypothetical protein